MKKILMLVLSEMFMVTVSVAFLLTPINALANQVTYLADTQENVQGTVLGKVISFSLEHKDSFLKIKLELDDKTITLTDEFIDHQLIKTIIKAHYFDDLVTPVPLSKNNYENVKALMQMIQENPAKDKKNNNQIGLFLNLLYSWPEGLPVFAIIDGEKTIGLDKNLHFIEEKHEQSSIISKNIVIPDGKTGVTRAKAGLSLCNDYGSSNNGDMLYVELNWMDLVTDMWTESFVKTIGGNECFGRCGKKCVGDDWPNNRRNIYTQRCFNHDGCVDKQGELDYACNLMFIGCIVDFRNKSLDCKMKAPSNLSASDGTYSDQVYITWSGVSGATKYYIYRATSSTGKKELLGYVTGTVVSDTTATAGTTYYYWVTALIDSGLSESEYSSSDSGSKKK